jgi:hypothetical protein
MEPGDLPDEVYYPRMAEVEHMNSQDSASFDPLSDVDGEVLSVAEVKQMRLPPGWVRGTSKERQEEKRYSYELFHRKDKPDVMLWFYYRGYKLGESASDNFRACLSKSPHVILPAELKELSDVIRDKSDPHGFKITGAHTESLNGKIVLAVQGRYVEAQEDAYTVYMDANGTGSVVRELHYRAPKPDYVRFLPEVKSSFRTIVWK